MNACAIKPWIMIGVALVMVLLMLWGVRASHREVISKYAKQWGVDTAMAAVVRSRRESRLSGILTWLAVSPVFVIVIGVFADTIGQMVPVSGACTTPSSGWSVSVMELTAIVYCLPFTVSGVALIIFLTPPRLIAYRRGLMRLRREDLPDHPTLNDFEAALPPLAPASSRIRLVSLAICAAGVAVLVWLTVNHASEVIADFIIPHRATPVQAAAIHTGLSHALPLFQIGLLVVSVPYFVYIWWALLTGERRAYRKLGAKWTLSPPEIRRMINSRRGTGYRVLRTIWLGTMFLLMAGAIGLAATPPALVPEIVTILMLLAAGFVLSTGLLVTCYARGSAYVRVLSSALQAQCPTSEISAATIAAGIDRKTIADHAWTIRVVGLFIVLLAMAVAFGGLRTPGAITHLAHLLPWR